MKRNRWTQEHLDFAKKVVPGKRFKEAHQKFEEKFKLGTSFRSFESFCKRNGIKNGMNGYEKRPLNSERLDIKNGYISIKVGQPSVWRLKHHVIYEETYGKIPKGYKVAFGDGDKTNFDINNLLLVSDKQMAVMNKLGLKNTSPEITKTGMIVADLHMKMNERKRRP